MTPLDPRINPFGVPGFYIPETTSTMHEIDTLASQGFPSGTLVVAGLQTEGRGQQGRPWLGSKDMNLTFSFLLKQKLAIPPSLLWGLGVSSFLDTLGIDSQIKWPNDVLVKGQKICGILVQAKNGQLNTGVGFNVKQTVFPDNLRRPATSLALLGLSLSPLDVLPPLVLALKAAIEEPNPLEKIQERLWNRGAQVKVSIPQGGEMEGVLMGLGASGQLLIQTSQGLQDLYTGEQI